MSTVVKISNETPVALSQGITATGVQIKQLLDDAASSDIDATLHYIEFAQTVLFSLVAQVEAVRAIRKASK